MREIITDLNQLREPTEPVTSKRASGQLADILINELLERGGADALAADGLAANQLGFTESVCVFRGPPGQPPVCLVNPVIYKEIGSITAKESCLSLPGVVVLVKRPERIKVSAHNRYLVPVQHKFAGAMARKAYHEIDHLNGRLIIDYEEGQIFCPVCVLATGTSLVAQSTGKLLIREQNLLYQRGYDKVERVAGDGVIVCKRVDSSESFISPRCEWCYDKEVAKDANINENE